MEASSSDGRADKRALTVAFVVLVLSCFRLAHVHLLWADEDYHLAAAINILHGKVPYRDFWYDKPPLSALYYLLVGGWYGWPLRLLDAGYILSCCFVAWRFAREWWGRAEGLVAALMLAFFTTFYLPSAVIPFAADAVMMLPHLLAVYLAFRGKGVVAGVMVAVCFAANPKALFVLASCGVFLFPAVGGLVVGSLIGSAVWLASLAALGAWPGYVEQVWAWGLVYAKGSPVTNPWANGSLRAANWAGFHALLVAGAGFALPRLGGRERWRLVGWLGCSFVAVAVGARFAPHYFLQLLPPLVLTGARGLVLAYRARPRWTMAVAVILMAVPLVRFGPRYALLAAEPAAATHWKDAAMDEDSQAVAREMKTLAGRGDSLFVWGYRPDIYVYTRMAPDQRYWDSQPLTGVPADRHLSATTAIYGGPAAKNRQDLMKSQPTWIVDGLGRMNPALRLEGYADLQAWLAQYEVVAKTPLSLIYRRRR